MTADEGTPSSPGDDESSREEAPSSPPSTEPIEPAKSSGAASPVESGEPDESDELGESDTPTAESTGEREDTHETNVTAAETGQTRETHGAGVPERAGATVSADAGGGRERQTPDPVPTGDEKQSMLGRLWHAQSGPLFFLREVATSAAAVVFVGLLLFGVSGVWPPMVAVESGSMEPHMHKGDLVFITEPGRYTPDAAYGSTGVVTAEAGAEVGYRTFGGPGSVIVYDDPGRGGPPIIHRAVFYVEAGENWYERADSQFVVADSCDELQNCPAPHAGFITRGDANSRYDQASNIAPPVRPAWITGIARIRIPYLGWVRLGLADVVNPRPSELAAVDRRNEPTRRPLVVGPGVENVDRDRATTPDVARRTVAPTRPTAVEVQ
jgi:signal peptidase